MRPRDPEPVAPVRIVNRQRLVPVSTRPLGRVVAQALSDCGVPGDLAVEVTLVRDRTIRPVNRDYLGRDRPTDVLAFPYLTPRQWKAPRRDPGTSLLGEVLVSTDQAVQMARERRIDVAQAVAHLTLHGVLHLMGYDHKQEGPARDMRRMERRYIRRWRRMIDAAGSGRLP